MTSQPEGWMMTTLAAIPVNDRRFDDLPQSQSCRLIDFASAEILVGPRPGDYSLRVRGRTMSLSMHVLVLPLLYVRVPEYWEYEVVGHLRDIPQPGHVDFEVITPLNSARGHLGVEIVGANRALKLGWHSAVSASE